MSAPRAVPGPGTPGDAFPDVQARREPRPVDPVCGMPVDEPAGRLEHHGRSYVFCSQHCLQRFEEQPDRFIGE